MAIKVEAITIIEVFKYTECIILKEKVSVSLVLRGQL